MTGSIALIGGEEFSDGFEDVHAALLEAARKPGMNGRPVRAVYLPFNAADDGMETVECWSGEARMRLEALGAQVSSPVIIDRQSAEDPDNANRILAADWIYIGGGKPQVGMRILPGTRTHAAIMDAHRRGALLSGASAGAMLLASDSWVITDRLDEEIEANKARNPDPETWNLTPLEPLKCLGMLPNSLIWPHFNQFFSLNWLKRGMSPPGCQVIGIDEQTALLSNGAGEWQVLGRGRAALINDRYEVQWFAENSKLRLLPADH